MLDTPSLFDSMELDNTTQRVASRRALALAHKRVESHLGSFLRGAQSEEEFLERLGLVEEDFAGYVSTASVEVGHDHPEHIAAALRDHYSAKPPQFVDPEEEDEEAAEGEEEENDSKPNFLKTKGSHQASAQLPADELTEAPGHFSSTYAGWTLESADFLADRTSGVNAFTGQLPGTGMQQTEQAMMGAGQPCPHGMGPNCPQCAAEKGAQQAQAPAGHGYAGPMPTASVKQAAPGYNGMDLGPGAPELNAEGQPVDLQSSGPFNWNTSSPEEHCQQFQKLDQQFGTAPGDPLHHDSRCPIHGPRGGMDESGHQAPSTWSTQMPPGYSATRDDASKLVTCPECGGTKKQANGDACPKCKGKGQVTNFGDSMVDNVGADIKTSTWTVTADKDITGLGEPVYKLDKTRQTPTNVKAPDPGDRDHPTKEIDIIEPIPAENREEDGHDLKDIGESVSERVDLPAAKDDNSGFSTDTPGGKGDSTKTFPKGDAANPVTRETISKRSPITDGFPSEDAVRAAFSRFE